MRRLLTLWRAGTVRVQEHRRVQLSTFNPPARMMSRFFRSWRTLSLKRRTARMIGGVLEQRTTSRKMRGIVNQWRSRRLLLAKVSQIRRRCLLRRCRELMEKWKDSLARYRSKTTMRVRRHPFILLCVLYRFCSVLALYSSCLSDFSDFPPITFISVFYSVLMMQLSVFLLPLPRLPWSSGKSAAAVIDLFGNFSFEPNSGPLSGEPSSLSFLSE